MRYLFTILFITSCGVQPVPGASGQLADAICNPDEAVSLDNYDVTWSRWTSDSSNCDELFPEYLENADCHFAPAESLYNDCRSKQLTRCLLPEADANIKFLTLTQYQLLDGVTIPELSFVALNVWSIETGLWRCDGGYIIDYQIKQPALSNTASRRRRKINAH